MGTIRLYDLLRRRALITRESAATLRQTLASAVEADGELVVDFAEVDAVTPSFIDELLALIEDAARQAGRPGLRALFLNAPTRLSAKFLAIGKGHGTRMVETGTNSWEITLPAA